MVVSLVGCPLSKGHSLGALLSGQRARTSLAGHSLGGSPVLLVLSSDHVNGIIWNRRQKQG